MTVFFLKGAAREGEGKGDPEGCQSSVLQTVFQGAGHGGAQCVAVWPALSLTVGL